MREEKKGFAKVYIWLLAGILLAAGFALMKVGGSLDVQNPMNQERIYDVSEKELTTSSDTCWYDTQYGIFTVQAPRASKLFARLPYTKNWNYLNLSISNLSVETANWTLVFYDTSGEILGKQEITVKNGENMIPLIMTEPFRRIRIRIYDLQGLSFSIDAMQLRMNTIGFLPEVFAENFLQLLGSYLLASILIFFVCHIRSRDALEILQYVYTLPGDYLGKRLTGRLSDRAKGYWCTFLFMLLFSVVPLMNICGVYYDTDLYKCGILVSALVLVLIALLSWEQPLVPVKWGGQLQTAWFLLWGWVCLSDLLVSKYYKFTGYVFVLVIGFFFFVWNNMSCPKRMMNYMVHGLECTFPIVLIYTLLCRKRYVGILYSGAFATREDMSLYALAILIAFLAELYFVLSQKTIRYRKSRIVLNGMGAAFAVYFLYRAYTQACILAAGVVIILFVIRLVRVYRLLPLGLIKTAAMLSISFVCSAVAILGVNWLNMRLPDWFGTNIVYENEVLETDLSAPEMAEIEAMVPGYFAHVEHTTEHDVKMIWTNYLREMNFFGNENAKVRVSRNWELAGNGLLEMAYRYGIFVLIPYTLLLISALYTAWKKKGYLMLATTLAFGITMLTQNLEQPFLQPLWIMFYLGMGSWFGNKDAEGEP